MKVVLTGAAGGIGRALRPPLRDFASLVRLLDMEPIEDVAAGEEARCFDLTDLGRTREALSGMDAVVHLAAVPTEDSYDRIAEANLRATYNVFEAARLEGVRRVVFASSNHATGFYRRDERVSPRDPVRPDSLYGVSKVFGEALGSLYADKFGLEVVVLRIGAFAEEPPENEARPMWLSPGRHGAPDARRADGARRPLRDRLRPVRHGERLVGERRGGEPHRLRARGRDRAARSRAGLPGRPVHATRGARQAGRLTL